MSQFSVYITNHRAQSLGHREVGALVEAANPASAASVYLWYPELGHIVTEVSGPKQQLIGYLPGGMGI